MMFEWMKESSAHQMVTIQHQKPSGTDKLLLTFPHKEWYSLPWIREDQSLAKNDDLIFTSG